ncbi:hypothetical protein [Mycobacterium sp. HUMS_1102779]|uniref:hypothetical protein n=1 Tax=Mycobacterium sp. HUMS_1102779 TaxID=3383487 RepID=UPI00389A6A57
MSADAFDSSPSDLPPLTKNVVAAARFATTAGPIASEPALRAIFNALADLERRVIALESK